MLTLNVQPWIKDDDIEAQLQDDFTHVAKRPEPQRMGPSGKSHGDDSTKLWLMYLDQDENLGREISGGWEWDRDDVLVFSSLFSTIVAICLMESQKLLPPDLNSAIMASLSQITRQLVSISNAISFQNVIVQNNAPFKPPLSAIRINVTWLLSLALSITHALSAVYPLSRARHNYPRTLHGTERPRPPRVVHSMPTLLHLSILLFITGLIDFLLLTNKIVAFCVLGYLSAFSFACLVFTALPSLQLLDSPRHPSLPELAWRISLIIILAVLVWVVEIGGFLCVFLSSIWNQAPLCALERPSALATWRDALESQIRIKGRSPAHGLRHRIDLNATAVQSSVDARPVCQTLSAPDQDQKIKDFVTRIPGVLGSGVVPCTTSPILSSIEAPSDLLTSDPMLFHDVLNKCIPGASDLTEDSRRIELRSSLKSLWYCGRAYHRLGNSAPLPHYVRDVFASPEMTSRIQNEPDDAGRVIGRCFASLIAKKLSSDANAPSGANLRFSDAELASLSAILGNCSGGTSSEMIDRLDHPGVISLANIISLLSGEIDTFINGKVPPDVEQIIQETVVILGTEALHAKRNTGAELPLALVAQFREVVSEAANMPAPGWLRDQLKEISEGLPKIPSEQGR